MDGRAVLVGFDASPAAERAVRWAAAEASLRGVPLLVCHAWTWPYPLTPRDEDALEIVRGMGALALDDGVRLARQTAPGLDVRPLLAKGTPPGALHVPAHADRPVVVVPAHERRQSARIVVGVDGSPASEAAVRFALREARLRDAAVTLVCAWWDPAALPGPDRLPFTDPEGIKKQAKARFANAVEPHLADYPDVAVERRFVLERAQRVLADNARDAMLLVVGDRGIGSSPRTLLGAVTRTLLHEAPSPVAVVHERDPNIEEPS